MNSIQKVKEEYQPETRITHHTLKNMNLFMKPHEFHQACILKEIEKILEMDEEEQSKIRPFEFLRDRILG